EGARQSGVLSRSLQNTSLLTGSKCLPETLPTCEGRGGTQAERTNKIISDRAFRWCREVLSASCYEEVATRLPGNLVVNGTTMTPSSLVMAFLLLCLWSLCGDS